MASKESENYYSDSSSDSVETHSLDQLFDSGLSSTVAAKERRIEARMKLEEALLMLDRFKRKLEEEIMSNDQKINSLDSLELQLMELKLKAMNKNLEEFSLEDVEKKARQLLFPVAQEEFVPKPAHYGRLLPGPLSRSSLTMLMKW